MYKKIEKEGKARKHNRTLTLPLQNLIKPIPALNVDRNLNKKETIKHYINLDLDIFGQKQMIHLLVTGLGKQKIILGFPWLQKHNPIINWQTETFEWQHIPINFRKQIEKLLTKTLPKPTVQWLKKLPQCLPIMQKHMYYSMLT